MMQDKGWIRLGQIYLRPITEADTDNIIGWRNSERVRRNFIYQEDFTRQGHQNWLKTKVATGEAIQFILCETQDDRPVGSVYFRDIDEKNRKADRPCDPDGGISGAMRARGLKDTSSRPAKDLGGTLWPFSVFLV